METKVNKSLSFNKKVDKNPSKGFLSRIGSPFTTKSAPASPVATPTLEQSHSQLLDSTVLTEKQLYSDIDRVRTALDYFLNSSISEAEAILKPHYQDSMYFSLGYSVILFMKCVMTFQQEDIQTALGVLKDTVHLAGNSRKKDGGWFNSVTSWVKGTTVEDIKSMTTIERHAELVYAEAYLLKALLSIIYDESVVSFLRESLNIRSSYNTYITLENYVESARQGGGQLDEHFTSGVALGVGCFSIILSMLPAQVIKVAEFIGFSSDRTHGLEVLANEGGWNEKEAAKGSLGIRREMCDMVLIVYHIILSKLIPLSDVNVPLAEKILNDCLAKYPRGVFFLYFNGRLMVSKRLLAKAEEQYQLAIDTQKDWKQLQHMCFWELGLIYIMQHKWQKAFDIYTILQKDSNWSKAVYTYLKAITLYMLANETSDTTKKEAHMEEVITLMKQVTEKKQKIAGKSIPMEKFVARKARKFEAQNNYLLLPDLEILNAFTAFDFAPVNILEADMKRINGEIDRLEAIKDRAEHYYDDLCLAEFLRAIAARMLVEQGFNTESMYQLHQKSLQVVFDNANKVALDHYIYYFAHYENGRMYTFNKDYEKAESEIQIVLKSNDRGQYSIGAGPHAKNKYSLASALVFKCHNCMTQIKSEANKK